MNKRILIVSGSPVKNGNTAALVEWFTEGASQSGAEVETVNVAASGSKINGCRSCRACQKHAAYGCVFNDDAKTVLEKMIGADAIVMATPLYFFSASSQIKAVFDRMFSLYKWDNKAGTMETLLKGKTFALMGSAFEALGLEALEKPFMLTAEYTQMKYASLLIPNAGVSGEIRNRAGVREQAIDFGKKIAGM